MPLSLPADSEYYSDSENQVTHILNGHTAETPKLLIVDRKPSEFRNGTFTVPSMRIRIMEGIVDSDGKPEKTKITFDLNIRWPMGATPTSLQARLNDLATVIGSTDFVADLLVKQQLPRA